MAIASSLAWLSSNTPEDSPSALTVITVLTAVGSEIQELHAAGQGWRVVYYTIL